MRSSLGYRVSSCRKSTHHSARQLRTLQSTRFSLLVTPFDKMSLPPPRLARSSLHDRPLFPFARQITENDGITCLIPCLGRLSSSTRNYFIAFRSFIVPSATIDRTAANFLRANCRSKRRSRTTNKEIRNRWRFFVRGLRLGLRKYTALPSAFSIFDSLTRTKLKNNNNKKKKKRKKRKNSVDYNGRRVYLPIHHLDRSFNAVLTRF